METRSAENAPKRPTKGSKSGSMDRQRKRVTPGERVSQLDVAHLIPSGMHGRWVLDDSGKIEQALDAGYSFLKKTGDVDEYHHQDGQERPDSNSLHWTSGNKRIKSDTGNGRLYLMVKPQEWHKEDQEKKWESHESTLESMRNSPPTGESNQYTKPENIRF